MVFNFVCAQVLLVLDVVSARFCVNSIVAVAAKVSQ